MEKAKVTRYQIYAIDKDGKLNHTGAKDIKGEVTVNKCKRLESPGDYPLRQYHKKTVQYIMHPIGDEEKGFAVNLTGQEIKPINVKDFTVL